MNRPNYDNTVLPRNLEECKTFNVLNRDIQWDVEINVEQGTEEWKECRTSTIGSSEAAAVFPTGISCTVTPKQLADKILHQVPPKPPNAYLQSIFDLGSKMEPVLRDELEALLDAIIVESGIFKHTVLSSSLDGIAIFEADPMVDVDLTHRVAICEFKYRTRDGAGWGANKDELGLTVFCQVQHQMRCTGIKKAFIYAGCDPSKCEISRRLWAVTYSEAYMDLWEKFRARIGERKAFGEKDAVIHLLNQYIKAHAREIEL